MRSRQRSSIEKCPSGGRVAAIASRLAATVLSLALGGCADSPAPPLPALHLDPARVAVTGISSGAIMAQQAHLAYSDHIGGAALLAGPPYHCAEGSLDLALSRCMKGSPQPPDAARLAELARQRGEQGLLAPVSGLDGDSVLVIHGRKDAIVDATVAREAFEVYRELMPGSDRLRWDGDGEFAHLWPTLDSGGDCGVAASPYLGKCGRDLAREVMLALFGEPHAEAGEAAGTLLRFDQGAFVAPDADAFLDPTGFLYRPPQCDGDQRCGLLIAFHGCEQSTSSVGERFVRETGLNRWADVHDVVVLYPQARSSYMPLNPKACWDWWGYSGANYDTREAVQLRWLARVTAAMGVPLD